MKKLLIGLSAVAAIAAPLGLASPANAVADRDCGDFASQKAAQIFYLQAGGPRIDPHRLDAEGDGIACESNPAPYYYGAQRPGRLRRRAADHRRRWPGWATSWTATPSGSPAASTSDSSASTPPSGAAPTTQPRSATSTSWSRAGSTW